MTLASFDKLPLFADDELIGKALLGPRRACEWPAIARALEAKGLPTIDPLLGGRYLPAVLAFFDHAYSLSPVAPITPDWDHFTAKTFAVEGPAIYFVAAGGFVKIGYSANWTQRLIELQVGCPMRLYVLHVMSASRQNEQELHRRFEALRVHGEWFRRAPELLDFIEQQPQGDA